MKKVRMGAWKSVGPYRLTRCIYDYESAGYRGISILPSHMFCPNHYRGKRYSGRGLVYADHRWAGTRESYHELCEDAESDGKASALPREPVADWL